MTALFYGQAKASLASAEEEGEGEVRTLFPGLPAESKGKAMTKGKCGSRSGLCA